MKRRFRRMIALALVLGGAVSGHTAGPVASPLHAVPSPVFSNESAGADSFAPFFSGDGNFLFFQSLADDLVAGDNSAGTVDLFRYEMSSGALIRVSSEPVAGRSSADWVSPVASDDGDVVVFASTSTALVAEKTNRAIVDIFWKRISTGEIRLISVSTNGTSGGNRDSSQPVMSGDGRYVAFESEASNLTVLDVIPAPAGSIRSVVYLRDIQGPGLIPASTPADSLPISMSAHAPSLSKDGHRLAYYTESLAGGLVSTRVVVRDNPTQSTLWTFQTTPQAYPGCRGVQLGADGNWVAFYNPDTRPVTLLQVHQFDPESDLVSSNSFVLCAPLALARTRHRIAFETFSQIGLWDLDDGTIHTHRVQPDIIQAGGASWSDLAISADGTKLVYRYGALDPADSRKRQSPGLFLQELPEGTPSLISLTPAGAPSTQKEIGAAVLTAEGRWVAFEASDSDLVEGDLNRAKDVFLRDLQKGTTRLISRHGVGVPAGTVAAALIGRAALNTGSGFLAFASGDGQTGRNDTNRSVDLFLQDLNSGLTRALTLNHPLFTQPYQRYLSPQLSLTGGDLAFLGYPVNPDPGSAGPLPTELYHWNLQTDEVQALMPTGNNLGMGVGQAPPPVFRLSTDGKWVVFESHTSELGGYSQIFLRDVRNHTNLLVSANSSGKGGNRDSWQPWVSPDGKRVLFLSSATDLTTPAPSLAWQRLYQREMEQGVTTVVNPTPGEPFFNPGPVTAYRASEDGQRIAFRFVEDSPLGTPRGGVVVIDLLHPGTAHHYITVQEIYGFSRDGRFALGLMPKSNDPSLGQLCRIEIDTDTILPFSAGRGLGFWLRSNPDFPPVITRDGRYVIFSSPDDSLVDGDANKLPDVFVRDVVAGTTFLLSGKAGAQVSGNASSSSPILSADGNAVAFRSWASDLVEGDFNAKRNYFVARFSLPDSDGDGIPDDWELIYFNTLSRDGTGDFDGDGQSDLEEYLAGTDPTGVGSVLRVITLLPAGGASTTVLWSATPGRKYRVEYRDSVTEGKWQVAAEGVQTLTATGQWIDTSTAAAPNRFYRVVIP